MAFREEGPAALGDRREALAWEELGVGEEVEEQEDEEEIVLAMRWREEG